MRICILVPLIYSIRLILLISADLEFVDTKLGISTFVFLTKWLSHFLQNEMQKSDNDSVQTCAQKPETTAVPRLAR